MFSIKKINNNEENNNNPYKYQNQTSIGSISKKSTIRQMTRPNLNQRNSQVPRLNELLNDLSHSNIVPVKTGSNKIKFNKKLEYLSIINSDITTKPKN